MGIQEIVVAIVALAAIGYLARRWGSDAKKGKCAGCCGCDCGEKPTDTR